MMNAVTPDREQKPGVCDAMDSCIPKRARPPNFGAGFCLPPPFRSFCLSLEGLQSWSVAWYLASPGTSSLEVCVLGLLCEAQSTLKPAHVSHDSPRAHF